MALVADGRHVKAGFLHFLRQAIAFRLFIDCALVALHNLVLDFFMNFGVLVAGSLSAIIRKLA